MLIILRVEEIFHPKMDGDNSDQNKYFMTKTVYTKHENLNIKGGNYN